MNFAAKIRRHPSPGAVYYPMDVDDVPAARGSRPDRLLDVSGPQERVQRRTMEQLVDSPRVVPSLDAPVPLIVEQLADVLSLVAEYEKEMDRIEDLILVGSPVSTADREAWRRWVNNASSSGSKRKKKKRRKRKLPKAGGRPVLGRGGCRARCCATTGFGEPVVCQRHRPWTSWRRFRLCVSSWNRSWCANATDHGGFRRAADHGGNHGGDSAGDKVVDMPAGVQRQVLGETEQKTEAVPQLQLSDGFVPGQPGRFFEPSFFVIEGSLGVALTPGVLLPGVRPPVDDRSCVDRHMR